jgi:hypothetical protein
MDLGARHAWEVEELRNTVSDVCNVLCFPLVTSSMIIPPSTSYVGLSIANQPGTNTRGSPLESLL